MLLHLLLLLPGDVIEVPSHDGDDMLHSTWVSWLASRVNAVMMFL